MINIVALRLKDQRNIDTMITDIKNLTLMQRIRKKKQFNKILNERTKPNATITLKPLKISNSNTLNIRLPYITCVSILILFKK